MAAAGRDGMTRPAGGAVYPYFVVGMLMLAYMLSFMDRVLISLVIEPIRTEFGLGDTEVGLLIGFGFVLFYSVLGLPFGALADRGNRRNLVVFGIVAWSMATAACGLASGFAGLFVARMMVGVGEATLSPSALSTIADRFERDRLGFAVSLYSTGVAIGGGAAFAFGGWLVHWADTNALALPLAGTIGGWRLAFLLVGALGLPLAIVMLLTVREAPRRAALASSPPFAALWRLISARRRAFIGIFAGFSFAVIAAFLPLLWGPALFIRVHGMSPQGIGGVMGGIVAVGGIAGVMAGGLLSDRLARRGARDAPIVVVCGSMLLQLPVMLVAYLASDLTLALVMFAIGLTLTSFVGGLQATTLQLVTPPLLRGRMMALYLLIITIVGMGLGPLLIGLLSEHAFPGPKGLSPALAIVSTASLVLALTIFAATRPAIRDAVAAEEVA